jgi:hypothetical protein
MEEGSSGLLLSLTDFASMLFAAIFQQANLWATKTNKQ